MEKLRQLFDSWSAGPVGTCTNQEKTGKSGKTPPPIPLHHATDPKLKGGDGPLGSTPILPPIVPMPPKHTRKRLSSPLHVERCCQCSALSTCKTRACECVAADKQCTECSCTHCKN